MDSDDLKNAEPLATIRFPGNPAAQCRHRWYLTGVLDANGNRVRLKCWKIGGRIYTTPEAVDRFIFALSADASDSNPGADVDTERHNHEVRRALRNLGI